MIALHSALLFVFLSLLALSSCITPQGEGRHSSNLVREEYIHRYGVAVGKSDWVKNGKDGQIRHILKDGVQVTQSYSKGVLHGKTSFTFPHSDLVEKEQLYEQGVLVAEVLHYASGLPMREERYSGDGWMQLTTWYEDGSPSSIETYEGEALVTGEYRNPSNVLESRVDEGQGVRLTWDNEGGLMARDVIQEGELVERVTYFPNQEPSSVTPYLHGVIHGERLTFLPGGLPNTVEEWFNGKQEGPTLEFQNGTRVAEIPYEQGKRHGIERRYREEEIVEEVTWCRGLKHGPRKFVSANRIKIDWYHEGEIVSRAAYDRLNPPAVS